MSEKRDDVRGTGGPGVAKVEPLTAFERLEQAIENLRAVGKRREAIDAVLCAFDAWKVARAAEPAAPQADELEALTAAMAQAIRSGIDRGESAKVGVDRIAAALQRAVDRALPL